LKNKKIITIDGPSASGKGSLARRLAQDLNFLLLDSGLLYRAYAYCFQKKKDHGLAAALFNEIEIKNSESIMNVFEKGSNITTNLRHEEIAHLASRLSSLEVTRQHLLSFQRNLANNEGLVADGRDMGTIVFPSAATKIFLTASISIRAKRRFAELKKNNPLLSFQEIEKDIQLRDTADQTREISPLLPADDALKIDSTNMSEKEVLVAAKAHYIKCLNDEI
jgi:CMP/dCMP kinase